jgi:SUKH superfamily protein
LRGIQLLGFAILQVAVLVVAGFIVCLLLDWTHAGISGLRARLRPESRETPAEYAARLHSPQFRVLETHFGGLVPESLTRLYQNADLLQQGDFEFVDPESPDPESSDYISRFLPADRKALEEIGWDLGGPFFPFAADGFGNYYCVRIEGDAKEACPVYFWDHEIPATGEEMKIADSLDEFLARPRRPGP